MGLYDDEVPETPVTPEVPAEPQTEDAKPDEEIDLLDPDLDSASMRGLDLVAKQEREKDPAFKGFKVAARESVIARMDLEGKQIVHNLRGQANRAQREALEATRAAQARERAADERILAIDRERAAVKDLVADPKLLDEDPGAEPDAKADPLAWMKWSINKGVRDQLAKFQGNLGSQAEAERKRLDQAIEEVQRVQAEKDLDSWIEATPEMKEPKVFADVEALLKKTGYSLTPQQALDLVLVSSHREATGARAEALRRTAALTQRPSGRRAGADVPPTPDSTDMAEIQAFYAKYPEAKARDHARRLRGGR